MILILAGAAASVAGAIAALAARDARTALGGLATLLVAGSLLDDPLPAPTTVLVRVVGAALAIRLLAIALRASGDTTVGQRVGLPDPRLLALAATAGALAGVAAQLGWIEAGATLPEQAPLVLGTGLALIAVGLTPLLVARGTLQVGIGSLIVLTGAIAGRAAATPAATGLDGLITTGAIVATAAAVAGVLVAAAERERDERLVLIERPPLPMPKARPAVPRLLGGIGARTGDADGPGGEAVPGRGRELALDEPQERGPGGGRA